MLLDEFLPEYDVRSRHDRYVHAPPKYVFDALLALDLRGSWITRMLFRLRGMPSSALTLSGLKRMGFTELAMRSGSELVLGLVGRFWRPKGDLRPIDAKAFRAFDEQGYAKAAWNFLVEPEGDGARLSTETRVQCLDAWSRQEFRVYWMLIAPFSSTVREEMVRTIKRTAEEAWRKDRGVKTRGRHRHG